MVSNERTLAMCFAFIFAKSKSSAMLNLAATSFEKADYKFRRVSCGEICRGGELCRQHGSC